MKKIPFETEIEKHLATETAFILDRIIFGELEGMSRVSGIFLTDPAREIGSLYYDSRLVPESGTGTFFAIQTERADGHKFIPDLLRKGVCQWVVSDKQWFEKLRKTGSQNVVLTENVGEFLAELSAHHRSRFFFPVIGVTGSNGKTIVKEWLSQLLEARFVVCKNPKSFNSQIGVPLSVWNLSGNHTLGLFEAGISKFGEMTKLEKIIRPEIGILTNLASAHSEGFSSEQVKFREKLSLFKHSRQLILSEQLLDKHREIITQDLPEIEVLPWHWEKTSLGMTLIFMDKSMLFDLPYKDNASLENLGNCISTALFLGVNPSEINLVLPTLNLPEMRLSLKAGRYGNTLIDDSYTNDINGLEAALQFATLQRREGQHLVLILSDIEAFSGSNEDLQKHLTRILEDHEVSNLLTIGRQLKSAIFQLPEGHRHFANQEELQSQVSISDFDSCILLIKGSRKFGLEHLVNAWQEKIHGTRLEINLDAMVHNLNFYKSRLPAGTGIMAMVKAFGYGSGDEEIARLLEFHRVEYLAVAYADEGIKLREAGISLPIMVMNPTPDAMDSIFAWNLEPEIYSFRLLSVFCEIRNSNRYQKNPLVHIKLDTGMHRLGFMPEETSELIEILKASKIAVSTVFTHLAGADEEELSDYSNMQIEKFNQFCSSLGEAGFSGFKRHVLNSAGILRFPEAAFEMVRLGIGLYGIEANRLLQDELRSVSRLKTIVSQVKNLKAGDSVGYGRKAVLKQDSTIATIAIGYSDGFRRDFSQGRAMVSWNGIQVPVLGNVCMDMCMVDVTGLDVCDGDEITIFEDAESIHKLAKVADTIPYEILTGIGHRVKRIFYRE